MQNITVTRVRVLSPVKRTQLRTYKPLHQPKPVADIQTSTISHPNERFCAASSGHRRIYNKKREDFDLCSSGTVLVLAKKINNNKRRPNRQNDQLQRTEGWRSCKLEEEEVFCQRGQRSQQKYRIREKSRSPQRGEEHQRKWSDNVRTAAASTRCRDSPIAVIDPWNLSGECEQLEDLF